MTGRQWNALSVQERELLLGDYPDAAYLPAETAWDVLPYWLRRCLAHNR